MKRALQALPALILFLCTAAAFTGAGKSGRSLRRPLRIDRDDRPIPQPKERFVSDGYAILYNSWLRHLSLESELKKRTPALNANAWDEVPDSTWFTNRVGLRPFSFEDAVNGIEGTPPEPKPWRVDRRNDSGYTPKIDIEDSSGKKYVLKFDPHGARERNSAAERIGTLIH